MRQLLLSGLIATSLASSLLCSNAFAGENDLNYNVVNLQAEASRQVSNDEMSAVLYIEKSSKQPAELAQQITKAINFAMAESKKYSTVNLKTGAQSTYPVYDNDSQKLKEWRGRAEIRLQSTDFKATSQLIADLQSQFQTQSIGFNVSDAQRLKVESELMLEASKNFQNRAQAVAQSWNKSRYNLVNLNFNNNSYAPQPMFMRAEMAKVSMAADSVPQEVSAGESKMSVNASGSIQLQ